METRRAGLQDHPLLFLKPFSQWRTGERRGQVAFLYYFNITADPGLVKQCLQCRRAMVRHLVRAVPGKTDQIAHVRVVCGLYNKRKNNLDVSLLIINLIVLFLVYCHYLQNTGCSKIVYILDCLQI